jgi:hypothetical protein
VEAAKACSGSCHAQRLPQSQRESSTKVIRVQRKPDHRECYEQVSASAREFGSCTKLCRMWVLRLENDRGICLLLGQIATPSQLDWTSDIEESTPAIYHPSFEPIKEATEMDSFVTNNLSEGQGKNKEQPAFPTSPEPNNSQNISYPIEMTDVDTDLENTFRGFNIEEIDKARTSDAAATIPTDLSKTSDTEARTQQDAETSAELKQPSVQPIKAFYTRATIILLEKGSKHGMERVEVDPKAPINLITRWMVERYELKTTSGKSFTVRSRLGKVAEIRAFCEVTVDTGGVTRQVTAYVCEFELMALRLGRPWLSDVQAIEFPEIDQFLILGSPESEYQQLEKLNALSEPPPLEILTKGSPKPSTTSPASVPHDSERKHTLFHCCQCRDGPWLWSLYRACLSCDHQLCHNCYWFKCHHLPDGGCRVTAGQAAIRYGPVGRRFWT